MIYSNATSKLFSPSTFVFILSMFRLIYHNGTSVIYLLSVISSLLYLIALITLKLVQHLKIHISK
jgi:hypothetical protein